MERSWSKLKQIGMTIKKHYMNCTSTATSIVLSLVTMVIMLWFFYNIYIWGYWNANWSGSENLCTREGACWVYVRDNIHQLIYGLYPRSELWRVNSLLLGLVIWLMMILKIHSKKIRLFLTITFIVLSPCVSFYLMRGGVLGLSMVSIQNWGGLSLNVIFSISSIACALPLGFILAVFRKKRWGIYSFLARALIDIIRSLPLVTLLFFASLVLPLIFRDYQGSIKIMRLFMIFTLFASAYIAEAIRGGFQSISKGQLEAAKALGFKKWQVDLYIVYPQALEVSLPSLMNLIIALFKDTTLLSTIAVLDIVAIMQATTSTAKWMPYAVEGYVFVGFIFWLLCYGLSIISLKIEKSIKIGR